MRIKTVLSIEYYEGFYYFGCSVYSLDNDRVYNYWTSIETKDSIVGISREWGIEVPSSDGSGSSKSRKVFISESIK
jgi:hypothetical protein